ncbi:MAG: D-hydantoinase, partial [Alphaproteobacteria bacterium MarineAlpha3_Bin5]
MIDFDLIITGGTIVTATDTFKADIGIKNSQITSIADRLEGAQHIINAQDRYVFPGGIEAHCHIEQESGM